MRLQNGNPTDAISSQISTLNKKVKNMNKSSLSKSHRFKDFVKDGKEAKDTKEVKEVRDIKYKAPEKILHGRKMSDLGVSKLKPKGI